MRIPKPSAVALAIALSYAAPIGLVLSILPSAAMAQAGLDLARQALDGDREAIERYVEQCDEAGTASFVAAHGYRAAGDDARALELLKRSAELGFDAALWSIAQHHVERQDWPNGYAWGRLAMLVAVHETDGGITEEAWPKQWSWQITQRAARNLRENEYADADALTERIVAEWYPRLTAETENEPRSPQPLFVERKAPRYPRDELRAGETGWSVVLMDFETDGEVRDVIPVAASNRSFARQAADAVVDWVIDPASFETWTPETARTQTIQFALEP